MRDFIIRRLSRPRFAGERTGMVSAQPLCVLRAHFFSAASARNQQRRPLAPPPGKPFSYITLHVPSQGHASRSFLRQPKPRPHRRVAFAEAKSTSRAPEPPRSPRANERKSHASNIEGASASTHGFRLLSRRVCPRRAAVLAIAGLKDLRGGIRPSRRTRPSCPAGPAMVREAVKDPGRTGGR